MKLRQGQMIIGYALCLIALVLLAAGIIRIWIWFGANTASRTVEYQNTRLAAGGGSPSTLDLSGSGDAPIDLTKEWVFAGQAQSVGSYSGFQLAGGGVGSDGEFHDPSEAYAAMLEEQAEFLREQAGELRDLASLSWENFVMPWTLVPYFRTRRQLRRAARRMEAMADDLDQEAARIRAGEYR